MIRDFQKGEHPRPKNGFGLFLLCLLVSLFVYTFSNDVHTTPPAENEPDIIAKINNRS